jgi:hypothetical protein
MRTVRSFACEDYEAERFYDRLTKTLGVTRIKAFAYVIYLWVSEVYSYFLSKKLGYLFYILFLIDI